MLESWFNSTYIIKQLDMRLSKQVSQLSGSALAVSTQIGFITIACKTKVNTQIVIIWIYSKLY